MVGLISVTDTLTEAGILKGKRFTMIQPIF